MIGIQINHKKTTVMEDTELRSILAYIIAKQIQIDSTVHALLPALATTTKALDYKSNPLPSGISKAHAEVVSEELADVFKKNTQFAMEQFPQMGKEIGDLLALNLKDLRPFPEEG